MDFDVLEENEEEEGYVIKDEYDEHLIYGEDVNSLVYKIKELNQNSKTVAVVGEVFHIENKELRNGKILCIMSITDNSSSTLLPFLQVSFLSGFSSALIPLIVIVNSL